MPTITADPLTHTIFVHDAGRGTTPPCPEAQFQRGTVVRVRNRKALSHFPREAVVAAVVPAGFAADYALADLLDEPRPLMIRKPKRVVTYILVNEGDPKPYLASDADLLPSGKPPVEIGGFARAPNP